MWKIIVQDGKAFLQRIENGIVTGEQVVVKFLVKEAHAVAAFVESELASPAVKTDLANAVAAGELALAGLATGAEGVVGAAEAAAIADAETLIGNYIEAKVGGSSGESIAKLAENGVGNAAAALISVVHAAFAKVITGLTAAAAAATGSTAAAS
jgi:hypothetical protein